ncbi:MAG: ROK family protein [Phycisphaerales bacterium JB040]
MPDAESATPALPIADTPHSDSVAVGVDLGGTNIQIGVVEPGGKVLARSKAKTAPEEGLEAIVGRIVEGIREACEEAGVSTGSLAAIGIGAPGPCDPHTGEVIEAVNLRWGRTPLRDLVRQKIDAEVFLDNDVNVAIFGEARLGAARGATDVLGCWVGTGVGGGLILGGRIYYGKHHTAGEMGHIVLWPGNAPGTRSIEHNCSRTTISNRIIQLVRAGRHSSLEEAVNAKNQRIKSKALAQAYHSGDALTCEIIDDSANRLGIGLANIVTLLSLEKVVLGGGLVEALGEPYVAKVRNAVKRETFPPAASQAVEVVASKLEDDAGIVGAALIALHRLGV